MLFFSSIHSLVNKGNIAEVEKFLVKKPDTINQYSKNKGIPVNLAIQKANVPMMEFLLSKGAKINALSLSYAIGAGNSELVKRMFDLGAKPNEKKAFASGESPEGYYFEEEPALVGIFKVYDAMRSKTEHENFCKTVIDLAFQAGLKIDKKMNSSMIKNATKHSTPEVIKYMIEKGFKVEYGVKQLGEAISDCNVNLVSLVAENANDFINNIIDKNDNNVTPIEWALSCWSITRTPDEKNKYLDIIEILINHGSDINKPNNIGRTPFYQYIWSGFYDTLKINTNDKLTQIFLANSTNKVANILYEQLQKGYASKAPVVCDKCKEVFILKDLSGYVRLQKEKSFKINCPHCKKDALKVFGYIDFAREETYWINMDN
jgi:ankyrin repeat protein